MENEDDALLDAAHFLRVSDGLRDAFAEVNGADIDAATKERWQRRLIAITTVAKRDLGRAEEQLSRFREDFRAQGGG
jgi:hypothetical protein